MIFLGFRLDNALTLGHIKSALPMCIPHKFGIHIAGLERSHKMLEFRVTKYDPKSRNEAGHYLLDEWTCYSEVGDSVSLEEYEKVERAYLQTAVDFARMWRAASFTISGLEDRHENTQLVEGQQMMMDDVPSILRSVLRAEFWCRLVNMDGFIHVGWDYYMYVGVPKVDRSIITAAQERGLFVEDFISPYHPEKCEQDDAGNSDHSQVRGQNH